MNALHERHTVEVYDQAVKRATGVHLDRRDQVDRVERAGGRGFAGGRGWIRLSHEAVDLRFPFASEAEAQVVQAREDVVELDVVLIAGVRVAAAPGVAGGVEAVAVAEIVWFRHEGDHALYRPRRVECRSKQIAAEDWHGLERARGLRRSYGIAK